MQTTAFFQSKSRYFPRFSRIFSERPFFWVVCGLIFGVLASFALWKQPTRTAVDILKTAQGTASNVKIAAIKQSYEEWKQIVEKRPDYRDGYMMLAWYAQELGKPNEAQSYIQKATALDPNYSIPEVFVGTARQ